MQYGINLKIVTNKNSTTQCKFADERVNFFKKLVMGVCLSLPPFPCGKVTAAPEQQSS
jgi:hypothetical protein